MTGRWSQCLAGIRETNEDEGVDTSSGATIRMDASCSSSVFGRIGGIRKPSRFIFYAFTKILYQLSMREEKSEADGNPGTTFTRSKAKIAEGNSQ